MLDAAQKRSDCLILSGILLIGAAVRLWGIQFGLPHTGCRPDESTIVNIALRFGTGDLNPHYFWFPTLYLYALFALYGLYFIGGRLTGEFSGPSDLLVQFVADPSPFYLLDRLLSTVLGIATIYLVFRLARHLFSRTVAFLAALFISLAYLHVRESHFGLLDVAVTFMIVLAIPSYVRCLEQKTAKSYVIAGILTGLAISTKWQAVLLPFSFAFTHLLNVIEQKARAVRLVADKRLLYYALFVLLTFLATTPYAALDFPAFKREFLNIYLNITNLREFALIGSTDLGPKRLFELTEQMAANQLSVGWIHHLRVTLPGGMGWPLLIVSLLGIGAAFKLAPRKALLLYSFPLLYYSVAGKSEAVCPRYMVPLIPFLCITAAVLIAALAKKIAGYSRPQFESGIALILAAAVILPSVINIVKGNLLLSRPDNRLLATQWVSENVPAGASVYQPNTSWWKQLQLHPTLSSLAEQNPLDSSSPIARAQTEFLQRSAVKGYELWEYNEDKMKFISRGAETDSLPQFIILTTSHLPFTRYPAEIDALLKEHFELQHSFIAHDPTITSNQYDLLDCFFLPYTGFAGVHRPGPNIHVYRRMIDLPISIHIAP